MTVTTTVTTLGLDLAKQIFQVHGVDAAGEVIVRRRLKRSEVLRFFQALPPCCVGMEACATAHHWARELTAFGHDVRLMPPSYVKAYLKRNKNDAADAEAICEAVSRPSMRFVPVKGVEQQGVLMLHRVRALLIRQRTMLVNALRGHMAEFGIIAAQGLARIPALVTAIDDPRSRLPDIARTALRSLAMQLDGLAANLRLIEARIALWHRSSELSRRLASIPGIGPIGASAIAASATDPAFFRSGREFAAWLGLVPRQNSSGGKERLGRISKRGDSYVRRLLIAGAIAVLRHARSATQSADRPDRAWARALLDRRPVKVVAVALANKAARIAWAVMAHGGTYQTPAVQAA